jgi:hypothetical protein
MTAIENAATIAMDKGLELHVNVTDAYVSFSKLDNPDWCVVYRDRDDSGRIAPELRIDVEAPHGYETVVLPEGIEGIELLSMIMTALNA